MWRGKSLWSSVNIYWEGGKTVSESGLSHHHCWNWLWLQYRWMPFLWHVNRGNECQAVHCHQVENYLRKQLNVCCSRTVLRSHNSVANKNCSTIRLDSSEAYNKWCFDHRYRHIPVPLCAITWYNWHRYSSNKGYDVSFSKGWTIYDGTQVLDLFWEAKLPYVRCLDWIDTLLKSSELGTVWMWMQAKALCRELKADYL